MRSEEREEERKRIESEIREKKSRIGRDRAG